MSNNAMLSNADSAFRNSVEKGHLNTTERQHNAAVFASLLPTSTVLTLLADFYLAEADFAGRQLVLLRAAEHVCLPCRW